MDLKPLTKHQIACGKILLECIAKGQYTIEYGEIEKLTGIPAHEKNDGVGAQVGELSKHCYRLGLPLISVMVVLQKTQLCSEGFFSLCNELNVHPEYERKMAKMFDVCMDEVKSYKKWYKFADYMGIKIDGLSEHKDTLLDSIQAENIEGALVQINATAYERDPSLRNKCISIHGTQCKICGFDAAKVYGTDFAGKIHVHHIIPLSSVKQEHEVNPETDMIPVCPNCHMIFHSKLGGVYTPDEVKKMIVNHKNI